MKSCLNCGASDWLFQSPQSELGSCAMCGNQANRCFLEDSPHPVDLTVQSALAQFASLMTCMSAVKFETRTERLLRSVLAVMNDQSKAFNPYSPKSIVWFVRELERELDSSSSVPEGPIESPNARTSAEMAFSPGLHLSWASRETFLLWMERGLAYAFRKRSWVFDDQIVFKCAEDVADWIEGK